MEGKYMLYNHADINMLESHKERNFYFKVFGGCIFNELVNRDRTLVNDFFNKLIYRYKESCNSYFHIELKNEVIELLDSMARDANTSNIHVDFDHHINQIIDSKDRGELADILITTPSGFIAIEVKLNSNWDFNKDIISNRNRINSISSNKKGVQVLLIRKCKWESCVNFQNNKGSNYKKLKDDLQENDYNVPFVLVFWEDILEIVESDTGLNKVCEYMRSMLQSKP